MRRLVLVAAGLALGVFPDLVHADILDRVAVSVGKEVITESQVILDLRVSAFLDQKPVDLSSAAKRQAAERRVDQVLILREAAESHVTLPSTEAAAGLVAQYAADAGYKANLARYGITEQDLSDHLLAGLRTLTFTDLRFRPEIQVSADDIRSYYDKEVAQPNSAAAAPSFEASRDQIEKLLVEQRVIEDLDKWLIMARAAANIQYRPKAFE